MKIALLLIASLLCCPACWATINNTMNWDIRTTGSDTNGGGFDGQVASPGTDFSQQNAAQVAFTDLIIGATTTQLTSVANPFGATYPGNVINITGGAGCTTGWYEVISVSGTTATMDRSVGTAASTCTGNLGGSLATFTKCKTLAQDGNQCYLKTGTYSTTAVYDFSSGHPIISIKGYGTTHDDGGTRPTLTTATNSVNLFSVGGNSVMWVDNVIMTNTAATPGDAFNGGQAYFLYLSRSKIGSKFTFGVNASVIELTIVSSEITGCGSQGTNSGYATTVKYSWIHDNSGTGINIPNTNSDYPVHILWNVISGNGGSGIASTVKKIFQIEHNDIVSSTNDGLVAPNAFPQSDPFNHPEGIAINNNIFYSNGGFGVDMTSFTYATTWLWGIVGYNNNAYGSNTSGARTGVTADAGAVTLTANPFVNSAGGNYALNSTAGGGAACKGVGYPQTFGAGLSTSSAPDIGATQTAAATSSATGYTFSWDKRPNPDPNYRGWFAGTLAGGLALFLIMRFAG